MKPQNAHGTEGRKHEREKNMQNKHHVLNECLLDELNKRNMDKVYAAIEKGAEGGLQEVLTA